VNGGVFQLRQQIVRCGLESIHFAVAGHGAGVVECKRDTEARIAPRRNRQRTDLDVADFDYAEKISVDDRGAVEGQFRSADVVKFGAMAMSVTSGRLNSELKVFVASV
jgi:hypothetical protein